MAFYGERFRREDEEDIWEELKRTLMNPVSDEEMTLKQQQEQAKINAVLEKMFPTEVKQIKAQEPYLRYEDLLDDTSKNESRKISLTSPQNDIGSKIDIPEKLKEVQSIEEMKDAAEQIKTKAGEVLTKDNLKKAAGVGLQAASVIPQARNAGIIAKGASALGKKIVPKVGRKLAQEISEGVVNGAASGALEGLGRGILTDENPIKTTLQDTAIGATLGSVGGAVGGNVQKVINKRELKNLDNLLKNKKISKTDKKGFFKKANKYYQNYEQGVETNIDGLGNIKLPNGGLKETVIQKPEHAIDVIDLSKNLRNSKILAQETPKHSHKYDITKFHHLGGKNVDYHVAENRKGDKYFYKITDPYLTGPKPEGEGLPNTNKSVNNIIPSSQNNLNPSQQATQNKMSYKEWLEELKRKRKLHGW